MRYDTLLVLIGMLMLLPAACQPVRAESPLAGLTDAQIRVLIPDYCGEPERDSRGRIKRSPAVLEQFERLFPLPSQFRRADFEINHSLPLVCGGCDSVGNLIWMAKPAKRGSEWWHQDAHEQLTMCPRNFHK